MKNPLFSGFESLGEHVNRLVEGLVWRMNTAQRAVEESVERRYPPEAEPTPVLNDVETLETPEIPEQQSGANVVSIAQKVTEVDEALAKVEAIHLEDAA